MGSSISRSARSHASRTPPKPQPQPKPPTAGSSPSSSSSANMTTSDTGKKTTTTSASSSESIGGSNSRSYTFPQAKLRRKLLHANKTPLVLVACGSFSPITVLHLQLFELAARYADESTDFEIVGNYLSPCSDTYGKTDLAPSQHRIAMCELAIKERNSNIMIDEWEALRRDEDGKPVYTPTADVLKRLDSQINDTLGGFQTPSGESVRARVMLLIGADLALTMGDPKVWPTSDMDILLGHYGAFIVERPSQCAIEKAVAPLQKYKDNIWVVPSFENDVSSTKIRAQIQNGEATDDLSKSVTEYIRKHRLYLKQNGAAS